MVFKARRFKGGAQTIKNRSQYLRALGEQLTTSAEDPSYANPFLQQSRRYLRESALVLPAQWEARSVAALDKALQGLVPPDFHRRSDLFVCGLVHPSYISPKTLPRGNASTIQEARQRLSMPSELTAPGASSLQVLRQLLHVHEVANERLQQEQALSSATKTEGEQGRKRREAAVTHLPTMDSALLLRVVPRLGLDKLLLFDAAVVSAEVKGSVVSGVPDEVLLAATTSLCGALTLTGGVHSVAALLDKIC